MANLKKSDLVRIASETLGLRILSPEYGIILDLFENGSATAGEMIARSDAASTTFYLKLRDLSGAGLIEAQRQDGDRRYKRYTLTEFTRSVLLEGYAMLPAWLADRIDGGSSPDDAFEQFVRNTTSRLRIRFFSADYQIILTLYDRRSVLAGELFEASGASSTKFYTALNQLTARGLILADQEEGDHRRRRYHLPDGVRSLIDRIHEGLHAWIVQQAAG